MDKVLKKFRTKLLVYCKSHSNSRTYKAIKESYISGVKATAIYISIVTMITILAAIIMDKKMGDNILFIDELEVSYTFLPVPVAILLISAWLIFTKYTVHRHNPMREYILFSRWYYSKDGDKDWYYGEGDEAKEEPSDTKSNSKAKTSKQTKKVKNTKPPKAIKPPKVEKPAKTDKNSK